LRARASGARHDSTITREAGGKMAAEPNAPGLTTSAEDYLKAIYALERAGTPATTADVAQRLGIASASVSGMLPRLAEQGLVAYERYRGATLTEAGRRAALRTIRRHRVIESYLVAALGYPWDRVHVEAERLEHAASDELIDRMAAALGEPAVDPHGAPIPTREGAVHEALHRPLDSLDVGERARVVRVRETDAGMLRYLDEIDLRPGAEVLVTARAPFAGPITVSVGGAPRHVGPALAAQVLVTARDV
jgi:DtxR family transcriptional regulator, Mn-dependent transcriptional regulator